MEAFAAHEDDPAAKEGDELQLDKGKYNTSGVVLLVSGLVLTFLVAHFGWVKDLYIASFGIGIYGALQLITVQMFSAGKKRGLVEIMYDLNNMPRTMRQLAVVTIFTWFAMFAWFIYCTAAITSYHYGTSDPTSQIYNDGADWVGVLNSWHNGVAALAAFMLPVIARKTSRVTTHVVCLFIGGLGLISLRLITDPHMLPISMIGLGIAWAGLLTMPYAILSSVVPQRKMGVYMGMFNFFIVIPQIIAAATMGLILKKWCGGQTINMMVIGGVSMIIAGVLMMFVKDSGTGHHRCATR